MATTMNMNPADDDFGFVTPEGCQAVFGHLAYDAAEVAAVQAWINRAGVIIAQGDGSAEDVRCTVEELADTHSEKAAAFVMERPELLAAAIKRGRKILRDRNAFALYRAHKLVAAGRTLESLTPQDWHRRYGDASNERPADLISDRCELVDALESWGMDELVLEVEADGTDDVAVLLRDSVHGGLVVAYLEDVDGYTRWWCAYRITEGKE